MSAPHVPEGLAAEVGAAGEAALRADPVLALLTAAAAVRAEQRRIMARYCHALGQAIEQLRTGQQ